MCSYFFLFAYNRCFQSSNIRNHVLVLSGRFLFCGDGVCLRLGLIGGNLFFGTFLPLSLLYDTAWVRICVGFARDDWHDRLEWGKAGRFRGIGTSG
jgi:hypothetical protein